MLSYFFTPVIMLVFLYLLNKYVDLTNYDEISAYNEIQFKKYKKYYDFIYILLLFAFTYALTHASVFLIGKYYQEMSTRYEFVLYPNSVWFWALPSLCLSFIVSLGPYVLFAKIQFGDDYKKFINYSNQFYGYSLRKLNGITAFVVVIFAGVFIFLGRSTYFFVDNQEITYREKFSFEEFSIQRKNIKAIKYCEYSRKGKVYSKVLIEIENHPKLELNNFLNTKTEKNGKVFANLLSKHLKILIHFEKC